MTAPSRYHLCNLDDGETFSRRDRVLRRIVPNAVLRTDSRPDYELKDLDFRVYDTNEQGRLGFIATNTRTVPLPAKFHDYQKSIPHTKLAKILPLHHYNTGSHRQVSNVTQYYSTRSYTDSAIKNILTRAIPPSKSQHVTGCSTHHPILIGSPTIPQGPSFEFLPNLSDVNIETSRDFAFINTVSSSFVDATISSFKPELAVFQPPSSGNLATMANTISTRIIDKHTNIQSTHQRSRLVADNLQQPLQQYNQANSIPQGTYPHNLRRVIMQTTLSPDSRPGKDSLVAYAHLVENNTATQLPDLEAAPIADSPLPDPVVICTCQTELWWLRAYAQCNPCTGFPRDAIHRASEIFPRGDTILGPRYFKATPTKLSHIPGYTYPLMLMYLDEERVSVSTGEAYTFRWMAGDWMPNLATAQRSLERMVMLMDQLTLEQLKDRSMPLNAEAVFGEFCSVCALPRWQSLLRRPYFLERLALPSQPET